MSYLRVRGNRPLWGAYTVPAAKNAVLPLLAACVLIEDEVVLEACPHLSDIEAMLTILRDLGANAAFEGDRIRVDCRRLSKAECISPLAGCMRSSLFLLGGLLGRLGKASLGYPGGCVIGARPIDIHLSGLAAMGVEYSIQEDRLHCWATAPRGAEFRLAYPSVGATVNLVCFAVSLSGESVLENVAVEPEVIDLLHFLQKAGADLRQEGRRIVVHGGRALRGVRYRPVGDRIVAATVVAATAAVGGEVEVAGVSAEHCEALINKIAKSSCAVNAGCDRIQVRSDGRPQAFSCTTGPYPAFATDMQALALAYDSMATGQGIICERVFESRFALARELAKMGADIQVTGRTAVVRGRRLVGANTTCCDLRAGAALVMAALGAEGVSTIDNIGLIDRGYERIEQIFASLGADIERLDER